MLRNLFKVAFRNFIREKFYTLLNVAGLAVGIAVSMLIVIYVLNEVSYDRYHSNADRIHRLVSHLKMGANSFDGNATFPPLAAALKTDIPEVELAVRISQPNSLLVREKEKAFYEENFYFADPDFFRLFDFKLVAGDRHSALKERNQIVLTTPIAEKYFQTNDWQQVVGRSIEVDGEVYAITAIAEVPPANSHFHFSAVGSSESRPIGRDETWNSMNVSTYVLVKEGNSIESIVAKIPDIIENRNPGFKNLVNQGIELSFTSQPLTDIHLYSNLQGEFEPNGDVATLYIFGAVALVVILLACVNFINLTTARSANRAKEVGVRKVLGSGTAQLVRQFTFESIIVVAVATLVALGLIELARVPFAMITGKQLSFALLLDPVNLLILCVFVVVLGVLAGGYPSVFMAGLKPALVLKGNVRSGFKSSKLRNSLVTIQFIISIVLISSTLVVQQQLNFMRAKKLGFDKENLLVLSNANQLKSQKGFIEELLQRSDVVSVGGSQFKPFTGYDGTVSVTEEDKENRKLVNTCKVDYNYANTLKLEFASGRNFSREFTTDSAGVILNEVAAQYLFSGDPIGKKVYLADVGVSRELTVIGVVKNFNFQPLRKEVTPLVFMLQESQPFLFVRISPGDYDKTLADIETLWQQHADVSFDYSFYDDSYNNLFNEEAKLGKLFTSFTLLALFIACLGLLGLAAYMSEQRSKELSIRKVLGATLSQIVVLLSKDFAKLIIIAAVLAIPVAYYVMSLWLESYAYRAPLNPSLFLLSGLLVLLVALLSVSYQSIKAALVNPVDALKNE